jgi:hypothetical protein
VRGDVDSGVVGIGDGSNNCDFYSLDGCGCEVRCGAGSGEVAACAGGCGDVVVVNMMEKETKKKGRNK